MELNEAIKGRNSVRNYTDETISENTIRQLIDAGIQAPSGTNRQEWSFAVIQDKAILKEISDQTKKFLLSQLDEKPILEQYRKSFENSAFNIFYNAPTLLLVLSKKTDFFVQVDSFLAAENIMLQAYSMGLGTCWIGFAQVYLNQPHVKKELGIPDGYGISAPFSPWIS